MKTTDKNKSADTEKNAKAKLKTDQPLAEKDEVKQAEANQRKKGSK